MTNKIIVGDSGYAVIDLYYVQFNFFIHYTHEGKYDAINCVYMSISLYDDERDNQYRIFDKDKEINYGNLIDITKSENYIRDYFKTKYFLEWTGKLCLTKILLIETGKKEQSKNMQELFWRFIMNQNKNRIVIC